MTKAELKIELTEKINFFIREADKRRKERGTDDIIYRWYQGKVDAYNEIREELDNLE